MNWLTKANAALNRIPALGWIAVIIVVLALMLSLNHQQAEKLPLEHVAGLYQSDMAAVADVYYNAQMYTGGRYEITRVEKTDDGAKDTVISTGIYEAMEFGYWMEDGTTGEWQAITLDHTGFYWRDAELDRLTHFHQFAVYGVKF